MKTRDKKMTLNKGKFYKNGDIVRPEHGNKEQIELLEQAKQMQTGFYADVLIKKIVAIEFVCLCGCKIRLDDFSELDDADPLSMIIGETSMCHVCSNVYEVIEADGCYDEEISLRLIRSGGA